MFCEQCGAELEPDARFCSTCGKQVEDEGASSSVQHVLPTIPTWRLRLLRHKWLIAGPLVLLLLGGAFLWMGGSEQIDLSNLATDPKVLTRARAARLIEQSKELKTYKGFLELNKAAIKEGEAKGLWNLKYPGGLELYLSQMDGVNAYLVIAPAGLNDPIAQIANNRTADGRKVVHLRNNEKTGWLLAIHLNIEAPTAVTVTGITDAPEFVTGKIASFTSTFLTPQELHGYIVTRQVNGEGDAHLKLYDDGWRVESAKVQLEDFSHP